MYIVIICTSQLGVQLQCVSFKNEFDDCSLELPQGKSDIMPQHQGPVVQSIVSLQAH